MMKSSARWSKVYHLAEFRVAALQCRLLDLQQAVEQRHGLHFGAEGRDEEAPDFEAVVGLDGDEFHQRIVVRALEQRLVGRVEQFLLSYRLGERLEALDGQLSDTVSFVEQAGEDNGEDGSQLCLGEGPVPLADVL